MTDDKMQMNSNEQFEQTKPRLAESEQTRPRQVERVAEQEQASAAVQAGRRATPGRRPLFRA